MYKIYEKLKDIDENFQNGFYVQFVETFSATTKLLGLSP